MRNMVHLEPPRVGCGWKRQGLERAGLLLWLQCVCRGRSWDRTWLAGGLGCSEGSVGTVQCTSK